MRPRERQETGTHRTGEASESPTCAARPFDRSSLTRWRQRMGEAKLTALIQESLSVATRTEAMKPRDLARVVVDTTVQPKAVMFPTDAKLLNRARERLVRSTAGKPGPAESAAPSGAKNRRSVARESFTSAMRQINDPIQPRRFLRARDPPSICVARSLCPCPSVQARQQKPAQAQDLIWAASSATFRVPIDRHQALGRGVLRATSLSLSRRVLAQDQRQRGPKVYSLHAPEVECIGKGKRIGPTSSG